MFDSDNAYEEMAQGYYGDESGEYNSFVDKFKPKKTTDDCYTPPEVYDAVLKYCLQRYNIDPNKVIRPFYPGGDYQKIDYPDGCCVVDNPPFSIIAQIVKWYNEHQINYFLFAPYLTVMGLTAHGATAVCVGVTITYDNGAKVNTAFVTNMEPGVIARSDPNLHAIVSVADKLAKVSETKKQPRYIYPSNVLTGTMLGYMSAHGIEYGLFKGDGVQIRSLDRQKEKGKSIFGSGYLLATKAAAEKAAAEKAEVLRWELSDREWAIIRELEARADAEQ